MATFKYKIIEFKPGEKMEKALNELGKEGWEPISVTPVDLVVKGDYDATFGDVVSGDTTERVNKILLLKKVNQ